MKGLSRRAFLAALSAVPVAAASGASVVMTVTPAEGFFAAAPGEAATIQPRAANMTLTLDEFASRVVNPAMDRLRAQPMYIYHKSAFFESPLN
jgi:hypothetical protein